MDCCACKKNVLVIGGGGREHAVVWKLSLSPSVGKIYAIPGNGGISNLAECYDSIKPTDIGAILDFVTLHKDIDLVVVTPDDPLALGLVNELEKIGKRAFGPTKEAAIIEASKVFSKDFMKKYDIPTAAYEVFDSFERADAYLKTIKYPTLVKADGLALGKGAVICNDYESASKITREMMLSKTFGTAGERVVIEEFLTGYEVSLLSFTDGKTIYPAVPARDYKRAFDNNQGLNTGGMGCYCPVPEFDKRLQQKAYQEIMLPTIRAMEKEGRTFKGVLYFGLMVTGEDIKVIEYNARFGDPETQVILPMLESDLLEIFEAVIDERLDEIEIKWKDGACVAVIAASGGYPLSYEKGKVISFNADNSINQTENATAQATAKNQSINQSESSGQAVATNAGNDVFVFHAGTKLEGGKYVTSGGRVLAVSALGDSLAGARLKAYASIEKISFEKMYYRKDICK